MWSIVLQKIVFFYKKYNIFAFIIFIFLICLVAYYFLILFLIYFLIISFLNFIFVIYLLIKYKSICISPIFISFNRNNFAVLIHHIYEKLWSDVFHKIRAALVYYDVDSTR